MYEETVSLGALAIEVPSFTKSAPGELLRTFRSEHLRLPGRRPSTNGAATVGADPRAALRFPAIVNRASRAASPATHAATVPERPIPYSPTRDADVAGPGVRRSGYFRYAAAANRRVRFELRSSANLTLVCGDAPSDTAALTRALETLRRRCADADSFVLRCDGDSWRFDVVDGGGDVLASSRPLGSEALAHATIKLTQLHGPQAAIGPLPA